ncbi:MAG TPA: endonuclease domain-containing protein [Polyangiaceae bacterium]|nr:endonuclease domain-containing protein [Polyangiaceae bacterium]
MRYGFVTTAYTFSTMRPRARDMRCAPTPTEALLWGALRREQLGVRFRRQVVLGPFIADFYAPSARLVVEVDGPVHAGRRAYDAQRDAVLAARGVRTLRVEAWRVESELAAVVAGIRGALGK